MAGLKLDLEGQSLEALLHKGILESLDTVAKEALVKEVVKFLTAETTSGYGRQTSPLLEALKEASRKSAFEYFEKRIKEDPSFVTAMNEVFENAVKKFFDSENQEKLINRMAEKLNDAFIARY